mmetsp:Transcript_4290/g.19335  ORF Transcript_4290/g.19335 Transcript_4290/m.19335 type:complete len:215 (+) Transcript_4290:935-1579(+)
MGSPGAGTLSTCGGWTAPWTAPWTGTAPCIEACTCSRRGWNPTAASRSLSPAMGICSTGPLSHSLPSPAFSSSRMFRTCLIAARSPSAYSLTNASSSDLVMTSAFVSASSFSSPTSRATTRAVPDTLRHVSCALLWIVVTIGRGAAPSRWFHRTNPRSPRAILSCVAVAALYDSNAPSGGGSGESLALKYLSPSSPSADAPRTWRNPAVPPPVA